MKHNKLSFIILLTLSICLIISMYCENYFSKRIFIKRCSTVNVHQLLFDYLNKNIQIIDSNSVDPNEWVYSDTLRCYIQDTDMYYLKDEIDNHDIRFNLEALGKPNRILVVSLVSDLFVTTFGDGASALLKDWYSYGELPLKPEVSMERRFLYRHKILAWKSKIVLSLLLFLFIIFIGINKLYVTIVKLDFFQVALRRQGIRIIFSKG